MCCVLGLFIVICWGGGGVFAVLFCSVLETCGGEGVGGGGGVVCALLQDLIGFLEYLYNIIIWV